ncbi:MAG TPA: hypothetical protein VLA49_08690 [Anaerolineales bacterium]|nr:hypothetical protein [Anaerolineales bacterium]
MHRTQILQEPEKYKLLTETARQERRSLSDLINELVDIQFDQRKQIALSAATQALLTDYRTDPELTAFQALNGDDFHA